MAERLVRRRSRAVTFVVAIRAPSEAIQLNSRLKLSISIAAEISLSRGSTRGPVRSWRKRLWAPHFAPRFGPFHNYGHHALSPAASRFAATAGRYSSVALPLVLGVRSHIPQRWVTTFSPFW